MDRRINVAQRHITDGPGRLSDKPNNRILRPEYIGRTYALKVLTIPVILQLRIRHMDDRLNECIAKWRTGGKVHRIEFQSVLIDEYFLEINIA